MTKKVLFCVTELHRPVGGLHRFTIEMLSAWVHALNKNETNYAPIVIAMVDRSIPLGDLQPATEYEDFMKKNPKIKVYRAERGGMSCLFIDSNLSEEEKNELHGEMWVKYRIRSEKVTNWDYYSRHNAYWHAVPIFAEYLVKKKKENIKVIDAQDWLAFPAGFLTRERIGAALNCRFHSGEFGRSLGKPDFESPPILIETAALQEADFIQGVSVHEAKFEIYRHLPLKQRLRNGLSNYKSPKWLEYQLWKEEKFEDFLLYEASEDLEVIAETVAGITNGIQLESWKKITNGDIEAGRKVYKKILPKKDKYVLFIGRPEYRKGIDTLIKAFAELHSSSKINAGLIIASSLSNEDQKRFELQLSDLKLKEHTVIYNGWIGEELKKGMFCSADVIALPSLYEPFGLVTLEVLAADMACDRNGLEGPIAVVGDNGGMSEVIRNGVNGFKVPMEEDRFDMNPSFLARVLKICLQTPNVKKKITKGGSVRVQQRYFDWNFVVKKIFEIYEQAENNFEKYGKVSLK